jgi:hypothetical protein
MGAQEHAAQTRSERLIRAMDKNTGQLTVNEGMMRALVASTEKNNNLLRTNDQVLQGILTETVKNTDLVRCNEHLLQEILNELRKQRPSPYASALRPRTVDVRHGEPLIFQVKP